MAKAACGTDPCKRSQPFSSIIRAAQYVRMSREHQKYSIANQSAANHVYAAQRGMEIVRTYSDEGRSGLSLNRRNALKRLITDVQSEKLDFEAIVVYDIKSLGTIPGCRRECTLRIYLQTRRHQCALLCRAVPERW